MIIPAGFFASVAQAANPVPISAMMMLTQAPQDYLVGVLDGVDLKGVAAAVNPDDLSITLYQRYRVYDTVHSAEIDLTFCCIDGNFAISRGINSVGEHVLAITPYLTDASIQTSSAWASGYTLNTGATITLVNLGGVDPISSATNEITGIMQLAQGKALIFTRNNGNLDEDNDQSNNTNEIIWVVNYSSPTSVSVSQINIDFRDPQYGIDVVSPYYITANGVIGAALQQSSGSLAVIIDIIRFGFWAVGRLVIKFSSDFDVIDSYAITPSFGGMPPGTSPLPIFGSVSALDYQYVLDGYGSNGSSYNNVRFLNGSVSTYTNRTTNIDPEEYIFQTSYTEESSVVFDFDVALESKLGLLGYTVENAPADVDFAPFITYEA